MRFRIYGASDDLIEFEGDVSGEIGGGDHVTTILVGRPDEGPGTIVTIEYSPKRVNDSAPVEPAAGCWVIAVAPLDEEREAFPCTITKHHYSACAEFDIPDGTPVRWWDDSDEEWRVPD